MQVFVTGGAGFIGQHLVKHLLEKSNKVIIYDNLKNSQKKSISHLQNLGAKFIKGDLSNLALLKKSIKNSDVVIHLAAQIDVRDSIKNPQYTHNVNVTGTLNLLLAGIEKNIKNFIVASSAAVYGDQSDLPLSENSITMPISPYGATKLSMENYLQAFSRCYDMNCISLRLFNVYGKGQSSSYAGVITKFLQNIKQNKPLIIFGDGSNTRDFVSIDDVVQAFDKSITKINGKKGKFYNIASGKYISIKELAQMMIAISGKKIPIIYKKANSGDIQHSQTSVWLAKKELGYVPSMELKEGLQRLIQGFI
jgi:UDP-glucose 4-epimerase